MTKTDDDANEKYNEKVLNSGGWIDKEFVQDVLNESLEEQVTVIDHKVTAAVGAGDNFLSILYKTAVTYTTPGSDEPRRKFLMVKGAPTSKLMLDMIDEMGIFPKEIAMYSRTLPAMQRYLKQYFPADSEFFAPESYKCSRPNTLVMQDIGESGYRMANRREQLDLDHCLVILRTLARFHALSVKLQQDDPELIKIVSKDFYSVCNREKMEMFLENTFPVISSAMEKWGENQLASEVKEIGKCIWDKLLFVIKPTDGFNVLNHGDLWINNMMFKYNEDGSVAHTKLVDFQLNRYTTPANDLHYFLFTSPKPEVLSAHMPELVSTYHKALMADLATLQIKVEYSLEQLKEDMLDRATFGVLSVIQILPIIMAPPSEVLDMDSFESMDDFKFGPDDHPMLKNYMNTNFRRVATAFLRHMESIGYLEAAKTRMQHIVDAAEAAKNVEGNKTQEEIS